MAYEAETMMRRRWLYPGDPGWKEARLRKLRYGLMFSRKIRDRKVAALIIREIRRVLQKD